MAAIATVVFSISSTTTIYGQLGSAFSPTVWNCATKTPEFPSSKAPKWSPGVMVSAQGPPACLDPPSSIKISKSGSDKDGSFTNAVPFPCTYTLFVTYSDISETISQATPLASSITTSSTKSSSKSRTTASTNATQRVSNDKERQTDALRISTIVLAVILALAVAALFCACLLIKRYREGKQEKQRKQGNFGSDVGIGGGSISPSRVPIFASMKTVSPSPGPGTGVVARRGTTINIDRGLDFYLLDGAGDSEIRSELDTITYLIEDYVETSYHRPQAIGQYHVSSSMLVESLSRLGVPEPTKLQIATHALVERTRSSAIRSLLAFSIFSALDIQSKNPSLLPLVVTVFRRAMPYESSGSVPSQQSKALNTWRRTSAYLLHPNNRDRSPLPLPAEQFESQIKTLQTSLQDFLQYFTDTRSAQNILDQTRGLETVIRACARLGYGLFSHPCEWRYIYEMEGGSESERLSELVVMPGLERVSGPDGEGYRSRQVICRPSTEKV